MDGLGSVIQQVNDKHLEAVLRQIREAGFDAVMMEVLPTQTLQDFQAMIAESGLGLAPGYASIAIPSDHGVALAPGTAERVHWFDGIRRKAEESAFAGLDTVFLAPEVSWGPGAVRMLEAVAVGAGFSQSRLDEQIEFLAEATDVLQREGIRTGLHNHVGTWIETEDEIEQTLAAIPDLESSLGGATFTVVFDQAPFVEQSIEALAQEGLLGLVFAVVVILIFLVSVRSTLVTAISIPTSVLATFIGLQAFGYSLNVLTLGALTIAIGRVVDDSIVVIENIRRHYVGKADKLTSIVRAVREVGSAITSSTKDTGIFSASARARNTHLRAKLCAAGERSPSSPTKSGIIPHSSSGMVKSRCANHASTSSKGADSVSSDLPTVSR